MHHTGQQIIAHTVIFYTFIRTNGRKVETWSFFFCTTIQHQTEPSYSMWFCLGIYRYINSVLYITVQVYVQLIRYSDTTRSLSESEHQCSTALLRVRVELQQERV